MQITPAMRAKLIELRYGVGYNSDNECEPLEILGLVQTGTSRFANWARITDLGRKMLDSPPGSGDGAAGNGGYSYREAVSRNHHVTAPQARGSVAISPPATALDVVGAHPTVKEMVTRCTNMVLENGKDRRTCSTGSE